MYTTAKDYNCLGKEAEITKKSYSLATESKLYKPPVKEEKPMIIKLEKVPENTPYNEMDGAIQWFTFHRGALAYPKNPSPHTQKKMSDFIMGIYLILRCEKCSEHAQLYTEEKLRDGSISEAVKNRKNLFEFFVDFHNYVNHRQGKKIMSYEEAKILYSKPWKAVYPSE